MFQDLMADFDEVLSRSRERGCAIATPRDAADQRRLAFSIFTQISRQENHAGLQVSDVIAKGLLYPMACHAYGDRYRDWSTQHSSRYARVREALGPALVPSSGWSSAVE